jgi:Type VI secretion system/phage-baseplate injector OB domain
MQPHTPPGAERWFGKYSGTVMGNEDPDKQGSVLVTVPTIFGATLQVWARPCFPYGHFFVPPVGTKVWVEFEGGDPQYPIWVGTWYPKSVTPAESRVTPPDNRVIQTASGHTIELDDSDGHARITIRHKDNSFLAIDDKGSVVVANKNGATLYLNADGAEASLLSEQGHVFAMNGNGIVMMNQDGASLDLSGDTVRITAGKIMLEGTTVSLGAGAAEPTVLGTQFQTLWTQFLLHTHPSAMGPTGPAVPPAPLVPPVHLTSAVVVK